MDWKGAVISLILAAGLAAAKDGTNHSTQSQVAQATIDKPATPVVPKAVKHVADADAPRDYSTDKGPWTLAKLLERLSIKNETRREVEEAEERNRETGS